jgi:hypothetical protein
MSTTFTPTQDHIFDLECSLSMISGISETLTLLANHALGPGPEQGAFGYLAAALVEKSHAAGAAFDRLHYPDTVGTADGIPRRSPGVSKAFPSPIEAAATLDKRAFDAIDDLERPLSAALGLARSIYLMAAGLDDPGTLDAFQRVADAIEEELELAKTLRTAAYHLCNPHRRDGEQSDAVTEDMGGQHA